MNSKIDNEVVVEDVVVLGVASVETLGGAGSGEPNGYPAGAGISEE